MPARLATVALLALPALAAAQAPSLEAERSLLQRQQQSDQFSLQLRQSQSVLGLPPADRQKLDERYIEQRRAQQQSHDAQLRRATQEPEAVRAGAAERFERERRAEDLGFGAPPQRGRVDADAGVRWTPTLEERSAEGVSWAPTLEKRRP